MFPPKEPNLMWDRGKASISTLNLFASTSEIPDIGEPVSIMNFIGPRLFPVATGTMKQERDIPFSSIKVGKLLEDKVPHLR